MAKKKNFLLLAIAVGVAGVVIGGISIWSAADKLLQP